MCLAGEDLCISALQCPEVMKVCIVGGGPAGLHTASLLLSRDAEVSLYEKDPDIGGMYRYSLLPSSKLSPFNKLLENKNFKLNLNSAVDLKRLRDMEEDYDAFVIATGAGGPRRLAIPGSEYCIDGLGVVKSWFGLGGGHDVGRRTLIVGMGNVSMDIAKFLLGWKSPLFRFPPDVARKARDVTDVTICSRRDVYHSAFSNPELRTVLEIPGIGFRWEGDDKASVEKGGVWGGVLGWILGWRDGVSGADGPDEKDPKDMCVPEHRRRWWERRRRLLETVKDGARSLRLLFNTDVKSIRRSGDGYEVELARNGVTRREHFDSVISSVGFSGMEKMELGLKKPVYYVGWARYPWGNVEAARADAHDVVGTMCGRRP